MIFLMYFKLTTVFLPTEETVSSHAILRFIYAPLIFIYLSDLSNNIHAMIFYHACYSI